MKVSMTLGFGLLVSLSLAACNGHRRSAYITQQVPYDGVIEHRFICNEHHFMTLVDDGGTLNLRPHPGVDVNGWGSSWYAQPFLPGAVLGHTNIDLIDPGDEGISVNASGEVSYGAASTYGTWSITLFFDYTPAQRKITGTGEYSIILDGALSNTTGDLNLYKIASNYLYDVPLLSGGTGDTGDMAQADVVEDSFSFTWFPPDETSCFRDTTTDYLSIDVLGQYNNVDTAAQGYAPIEAAYKPSLKVTLESQQTGLEMVFGGIYNWDIRQDFWEDNIGITPLILKESTDIEFHFDVEFESKALPEYYGTIDEGSPATLRATLHDLIDDHTFVRHTITVTYPFNWDVLNQAQEDPNNPTNILDVYKNASYLKQPPSTDDYEREHTWPTSYGFPYYTVRNYPYADCHHIFHCDESYNRSRGHRPYQYCDATCDEKPTDFNNGQGGGEDVYPGNSNWTTTGAWETWIGRRGDVARALMYMDVRYEGGTHGITGAPEPDLILTDNETLIANSDTGSNESTAYMGMKSVLLLWHVEDPVDELERYRNDVVFLYQGNRNPFIDHPEWVDMVFP